MPDWNLSQVGDSTLVIEFEQEIDPAINDRVMVLALKLRSIRQVGIQDIVESYCDVTVHYDPLITDVAALIRDLKTLACQRGVADTACRHLVVPVCYGGSFGPDLVAVARFGACSTGDVIERHTSVAYRVYMLGFLPGFAYMASVDESIAMPRRATPRLGVARGSVGIAGKQTGIYPSEAPGGWQLIGQTPLKSFDASRPEPFLFRSGDTVRFEAIGENEYRRQTG